MANLLTPPATLSYPNLFKARLGPNAKPGEEPKFSAALVFTREAFDSPEMRAIKDEVVRVAREKFGQQKADAMIREKSLKLPFRTDIAAKGYPEEFVAFINISSKQQPGIVSRYAGKDGKPAPITDEREMYAGCVVRASVRAYAYGGAGTTYAPGVALGLQNVQKMGDGDRIDGKSDASDDFDALESAPAAMPGVDTPTQAGSTKEDMSDLLA